MGKATELNSIVDDLLTAARIEGGTVPTDTKTLDLRRDGSPGPRPCRGPSRPAPAEMTYSEPDEPVAVSADREQLARIIDNPHQQRPHLQRGTAMGQVDRGQRRGSGADR